MKTLLAAAFLAALPAFAGAQQGAPAPAPRPSVAPAKEAAAAPAARAAVTRISYWSTRPGKGTEARAFWKTFATVFAEMKAKRLIVEFQFLEPVLHTGQDWDIAYIWVCADLEAFARADQYFSDAVGKMDGSKISTDFEAAFEGAKHRDELWKSVDMLR